MERRDSRMGWDGRAWLILYVGAHNWQEVHLWDLSAFPGSPSLSYSLQTA